MRSMTRIQKTSADQNQKSSTRNQKPPSKPPTNKNPMNPTPEIPKETSSTISRFLQIISKNYKSNENTLFRGQRNSDWDPIPKIARNDFRLRTLLMQKDTETEIFEEFTRLSTPRIPNNYSLDSWDLLALAQHHGLPTRLLDWTSNPLVALWFAVREQADKGKPAIVWCLDAQNSEFAQTDKQKPFEINKTLIFRPRHHDSRIVAQSGWFTIHRKDPDNGNYSNLIKVKNHNANLRKILIPSKSFPEIRHGLAQCGINHASLFPDLSGLCQNIQWRFFSQKDEEKFESKQFI